MITICPYIMNIICKKYLYKIVNMIDYEKKKFVRVVICKQLSIAINTISFVCINKNPDINHSELLFLFDDYESTINDFLSFLKNFLIITLIHYTKKNTTSFYAGLLKYFYSYKTGELIESLDLDTAKKRFIDVIIHRKWKQLQNAEILQSIIYIYTLQDDNKVDYIGLYLIQFRYTLVKMFTIWTIGFLLDRYYVIPLLSIFFMLYGKPLKIYFEREQTHKYCFRLLALIVGIFIKSDFLISFICEFGYIVVVNRVMFTIVNYIYDKSEKLISICIHHNRYNIFLIGTFIYIELVKLFINYFMMIIPYEILILNFVFNMTIISDNYKRIIGCLIILLGILSEYHCIHILYILGLSYLFINIDHYIMNNKNVAISVLTKKSRIFDSYYGNNHENNNDKDDDSYINNDNYIIPEENDDLVDSSIQPNKPVIYDENDRFNNGVSVKIYDNKVGIIPDYNLSKSKIYKKK